MFTLIWLLGAVGFWSLAGFILYKIAEEEGESFLMKHMILGVLIVFVVGLVPILNLIGIIFAIGVIVNHIMDDDSGDNWWNRPAVSKKKSTK